MNPTLLLMTAAIVSAMPTEEIESFNYPNQERLELALRISTPGTPPLELDDSDNKRCMKTIAPFASNKTLARISFDKNVTTDLSEISQFSMAVRCDAHKTPLRVSMYFRSGKGWYSGSATLRDTGWTQLTYKKSDFYIEGQPAGWDKIDTMRIAVWRPIDTEEFEDLTLYFSTIAMSWSRTAIVVPDDKEGQNKDSHDVANLIQSLLEEGGIHTELITQSSLIETGIQRRNLVILPYNRLTDEQTKVLQTFVDDGGKLFLNYTIPRSLQKTVGFKVGTYYRPKKENRLASFKMTEAIPGAPEIIEQGSWNIVTAIPVEHNARSIANWIDVNGHDTQRSAVVISDRAAYFSHIILNDNREQKKNFLLGILGELQPSLWMEIAEKAEAECNRIGHYSSYEEFRRDIKSENRKEYLEMLDASDDLTRKAEALQKQAKGYEAQIAWKQARKLRVNAYLKSQPSSKIEARAFWEHDGTGPYPGDWDRACKELKEAGFNMIITNMLDGTEAHYPSKILKPSWRYRKYGDQIKQCLKAAKKHGLEVHIWKVNHKVSENAPKADIEKLMREGRLQKEVNGKESRPWLNPAHPKNFELERDSMLEIVRNYKVDGIHFDYIRYPGNDYCYSDYSRTTFEKQNGIRVKNWPEDCHSGKLYDAYRDWRADQVTRTVKSVSDEARKINPSILISAAVFREYPSCRQNNGQDWRLWAQRGYLDFLCPMDYTIDDNQFESWIEHQLEMVDGRIPVYPGIGSWLMTPDQTVGQIVITRKWKTGGFTVFNLNREAAKTVLPAVKMGVGSKSAQPSHKKQSTTLSP